MSTAPADLLAFRRQVQDRTGLSPAEVGIVGDGAHARTGGYHEGQDVLVSIGRYHPPATAHVGSAAEDYSARKLRDRSGLTNSASAVDIGSGWRQGRAVWLRWNVALVAALHGDADLAAVRAINYSTDGLTKHRTDREHGWAVEDSTDTVLTHTHVELYRDTEGRRAAALARLLELIDQAITGGPMAETPELAAALNASGNSWAAAQLIDPYEVPRPANTPGSTPVKVSNPLAQLLHAIAADVAAIRAESGTVGLTDAQVAALGAQIEAALGARLTALEDGVDKLMQAARAAGAAVG